MRHSNIVYAVTWSRDGKFIVTGSYDKTARVWEADTGWPVGPPLHHPDIVDAVAISPDGTMLATGCDDKVARLWKFPQPLDWAPERIQLWIEVTTGMTLTESDAVQSLDAAAWRAKRKQLDKLGGPPF
jgi:WD40 repeat protein